MKKLLLLLVIFSTFGCGIHHTTVVEEKMPVFPGGDKGLFKHVTNIFNYPDEAKKLNITGKVYVQYTVNINGEVTGIKILKGVHKLLDDEAIRIVKSFPKYEPGLHKGKPTPIIFTIPINFTLN
jgi:TonB family protein